MFQLNENFEVDQKLLKCDYIRYSPAEASTRDTLDSQICFKIPRVDCVFSLSKNYLVLNFEIVNTAVISR